MKQNKVKLYAKALAEIAVKKHTSADENKITENFVKLLVKSGSEKKAKEIVDLAQDLFIKKTGRRKVILETARRVGKKELIKSFEMAGDIVQEKINKDLIAGIKITVNDKQLDFSMKKKLEELFK